MTIITTSRSNLRLSATVWEAEMNWIMPPRTLGPSFLLEYLVSDRNSRTTPERVTATCCKVLPYAVGHLGSLSSTCGSRSELQLFVISLHLEQIDNCSTSPPVTTSRRHQMPRGFIGERQSQSNFECARRSA